MRKLFSKIALLSLAVLMAFSMASCFGGMSEEESNNAIAASKACKEKLGQVKSGIEALNSTEYEAVVEGFTTKLTAINDKYSAAVTKFDEKTSAYNTKATNGEAESADAEAYITDIKAVQKDAEDCLASLDELKTAISSANASADNEQ